MESDDKKVVFNYKNIIERAETSLHNQKLITSSNHYFNVINNYLNSKGLNCEINSETFEYVKSCFLYAVILLSPSLGKEKMINYILMTEDFNLSTYMKMLLCKINENKIVHQSDFKEFFENCPLIVKKLLDSDKDFFRLFLLEHNIISIGDLYETISFKILLNFIDPNSTTLNEENKDKKLEELEESIFKLIVEGKIKAKIDQNNKFLIYSIEENQKEDKGIKNFCNKLIAFNHKFSNKQ